MIAKVSYTSPSRYDVEVVFCLLSCWIENLFMCAAVAGPPPEADSFEQLSQKLGIEWPSIRAARSEARNNMVRLQSVVAALKPPPNTSVVVYGSLAREEWTSNSDIDWTLLIDGPSDMGHYDVTRDVANSLAAEGYREPGRAGAFGTMASSHELLHRIGGCEDTNSNLTRRILLLLESASLSDAVTHERVIRAILQRYVVGDPPASREKVFHAPLFLLNDVVRFWRTMTVDYATKKWQRSNAGWALRNIKLRMSRKLLFAKGMLLCFLCDPEFAGHPRTGSPETIESELVNLCFRQSRRPAIELLSETILQHMTDRSIGKRLVGAYDRFLTTLRDPDRRKHLEDLPFERAEDPIFEEQRRITRDFRESLESFFFDSNPRIAQLTRKYGVF